MVRSSSEVSMHLTLSPETQKLIDDRVKTGKYSTPEDVVAAAVANLAQQETFGDFAPGWLNELLAEGGPDIGRDDVLDLDQAFTELRRLSTQRRSKAG